MLGPPAVPRYVLRRGCCIDSDRIVFHSSMRPAAMKHLLLPGAGFLLPAALPIQAPGQPPPVNQYPNLTEWINKLGSDDPDERRQAVAAIGKIGPAAVPALRKKLSDSRRRSRIGAAEALAELK